MSSLNEALKLIAKPTFKEYTVYNEKFAGIYLDPSSVTLNKPSYVGVSVLEIFKALMYRFHYDVKARYGNHAKLLMTDMDSLFYHIETEDWYDDIRDDVPAWYDTSAYPKDHPAGLPRVNKKVIGMMKDELKGRTVTEFCGNRAKSYYTFTVDDYPGMCDKKFWDGGCNEKDCIGNGGKKCKGIKKSVVKKELTIEDYKECVLGGKGKTLEQVNFRSYKHEIFTERVRKVGLSLR